MSLEIGTGGLGIGTGGAYTVSGITLTSAALRSTYNGVGVIPPSSATAGYAISSNYLGVGETTFWNLVEGGVGFKWHQKTGAGTETQLGSLKGVGTTSTEFDLAAGVGADFFLYMDATEGSLGTVQAIPFAFYTQNIARLRVSAAGAVAILTGPFSIPTSTPASAAAAGVAGTIAWDASFVYICTAANTWKRVAIATW